MTVRRITLVWRAMTLALVLAMILSGLRTANGRGDRCCHQEVEKVVEKTV